MPSLQVDIWSDVACPWCYVGKRRLESALKTFAHGADVRITWHAFELDPAAPRTSDAGVDYAARLGKKYGTDAAQAQVMIDRMTATAKTDGLDLRFDHIRPGNTFDAHRLIHLGHERGLGDAVKERMLHGYLTDGLAIGDPAVLAELAIEAGLARDEVDAVLASDRYAAEVRHDEALARELGIRGVPFFVLDKRIGLSGAQPVPVMLAALEQAWASRAPEPAATDAAGPDGAVCGPDGCA